MAENYGLHDQIRFEGLKSRRDLLLYYNAADLFVLPTKIEGFGQVFVEAMLCGCPVLGGAEVLTEILPSARCGYHIPSSSPEVWTESIMKALEQSWSKEEIHELARIYTWEVLGEKYENLYKKIAG
jgi:glycosyltransferase involved in cell wall biosynthesis